MAQPLHLQQLTAVKMQTTTMMNPTAEVKQLHQKGPQSSHSAQAAGGIDERHTAAAAVSQRLMSDF